MKTVEFELDYTLPETGYYCTCCKNTEIDHSGTYVLASEAANAILATHKKCVDEAEDKIGELDSSYQDRLLDMEAKVYAAQERELVLVEEMKTLCDLATAMNDRLHPNDISARFERLHNLLTQVDICRAALVEKEE